MRTGASLAFILVIGASALGADALEEQAQAVVQGMGGPRAVFQPRSIAALTEEERQILIRYYRSRLDKLADKAPTDVKVRIEAPQYRQQLLKLGDSEETSRTMQVFRESGPGPARDKAVSDLLGTQRPEVIALLAPAMMVDEPFVIPLPQGDVGSPIPFSYAIANSLLVMVAESPYFTDEVRKWADDNSKVNPQKSMPMIRGWWRENEAALKAGTFKAVKPGVDLLAAELAAKAEINALQQKYREGLIAKGLSPADPANWKQWTEEIYPSLMASSQSESPPEVKPTQPKPTVAVSKPPAKNEREGILYVSIGGGALIVILALLWVRFRRVRS
jgi:hypothetical protein